MRVTKEPEIRHNDILKAALELFRDEGFEKISVESIAKKAGVAKGSFYNYFKSKEDVYQAAISAIATQTLSAAKEILSEKVVSPKERLTRYINWTYKLAEDQERSLSRVLAPDANSSQREMYLRAIDEGNTQMFPMFAEILAEGLSTGEFEISNAEFTAAIILGAFRGLHIAFYNNLQIDMATNKVYLYDFLSRLLGCSFNYQAE